MRSTRGGPTGTLCLAALAASSLFAGAAARAQEHGHPKENALEEILGDLCVEANENGRKE